MKKTTKLWSSLILGVLFMGVSLASASEKAVVKEWAFLTFLNGFNNLDSFGYSDMNEMEKIGSTDRIHVVSQWASLKTKQVKRVYLGKDSDPGNVTSPVVENLGRVDMGDYRTLVDFIKWAAKKYPARHYFVNVWNHGNGWHRFDAGTSVRDLSYDDLSGNKITTEQLGVALAEASREIGQKIDIFGSDSCLMAMAEVAGQMRDSVGTFIGSEEVEPADGWPYDALLTKWNAGGEKSATDVAKILTQVYVESYGSGRDTTLSGVDLGKYSTLVNSVRDLGQAIRTQSTPVRAKILRALGQTQSYSNSDYKDLGDFVDQLAKDSTIEIRGEILTGVKSALQQYVVANQTSSSYAKSQGVSIWLPEIKTQYSYHRQRYSGLTFNQETGWSDALAAILGDTGTRTR